MTKREYATYHVGLKLLLKKGDSFLFLKGPTGKFDLPGGRIDTVEHNTPLEQILDREVREELGERLRYKLNEVVFNYRRHFEEKGWHIFLTVYSADYISGDIVLSDEHTGMVWIDPNKHEFKVEEFISEQEYNDFKKHLNF